MQYFKHTKAQIRIINDAQTPSEFSCTPEVFQELEPDYQGLPAYGIVRYWTPEKSYVELDGGGMIVDGYDCGPYAAKVAQYAAALPHIYAHVSMSKSILSLTADPQDSMIFSASLKATDNPADPSLPITAGWIIRLRNKDGMVCDAFAFALVNGASGDIIYVPPVGILPQVLYVEEADFDSIELAGQRYQVKLAAPVEFTLYRTL